MPQGVSFEAPDEPVVALAKLTAPRVRPEVVERPHLTNRVLDSSRRVTAISGPAGAGKSTLMAQLYAAAPTGAWYSIDEADGDPVVLWWGLIEATRGAIDGFGDDYRARLVRGGTGVVDDVVSLVTNELQARDVGLHLFIDDVHRIAPTLTRRTLQRLVMRLPERIRITLSSRDSTAIPLARLRVEGNLLEITSSELALSEEEARRLLDGFGVQLASSDLDVLVERTEGWPAGLQLAGIALARSTDLGRWVRGFGGADKVVADYLVTEVLHSFSPDDTAFMVETSILGMLSGGVCDAVTGRTDSADRLRRLESQNAFVIALDRAGHSYRYHHLFADLLAARLRDRDPGELRDLHGRAFDWLKSEGGDVELGDAIDHGLASGRRDEAADLLCSGWWRLLNVGRLRTARDLVERFDPEYVKMHQPLALAAAFIDGMSGDLRGAQRCIDAAQVTVYDGDPPDRAASMASSLALTRGSLALDGVDRALEDGEIAYELEPPYSPWWHLAALIVGLAHTMRGEVDQARPYFEEASSAADDAVRLYALAELALAHIANHDLHPAEQAAAEACQLVADGGLEDLVQAATAFGAAASVALEHGDRPRATSLLSSAARPMGYVGQALPMDAMHTEIILAGVALELGEHALARDYIERAARIDGLVADTGTMGTQLAELRAQLPPMVIDDSDDTAPPPLTEREREVLHLLPFGLTNREIGEELFLSRNTIKTYLRRLYQRLDAGSRYEAVARARELGLLQETMSSRLLD